MEFGKTPYLKEGDVILFKGEWRVSIDKLSDALAIVNRITAVPYKIEKILKSGGNTTIDLMNENVGLYPTSSNKLYQIGIGLLGRGIALRLKIPEDTYYAYLDKIGARYDITTYPTLGALYEEDLPIEDPKMLKVYTILDMRDHIVLELTNETTEDRKGVLDLTIIKAELTFIDKKDPRYAELKKIARVIKYPRAV